jgi:hypothetical protein
MRSLLEELADIKIPRKDLLISSKAKNIVESTINLFDSIREEFGDENCDILLSKFILSVKKGDSEKFIKKLDKIIKEYSKNKKV